MDCLRAIHVLFTQLHAIPICYVLWKTENKATCLRDMFRIESLARISHAPHVRDLIGVFLILSIHRLQYVNNIK